MLYFAPFCCTTSARAKWAIRKYTNSNRLGQTYFLISVFWGGLKVEALRALSCLLFVAVNTPRVINSASPPFPPDNIFDKCFRPHAFVNTRDLCLRLFCPATRSKWQHHILWLYYIRDRTEGQPFLCGPIEKNTALSSKSVPLCLGNSWTHTLINFSEEFETFPLLFLACLFWVGHVSGSGQAKP